ncbi:DUF6493 family protein, partial [Actinoplanes octamycinicus]
MVLGWEVFDERVRDGDVSGAARLLREATEAERLAFGREVKAHFAGITAPVWWRGRIDPSGSWGLAVLGSMPSAAATMTLLRRPDMREKWGRIPVAEAVAVLRARRLPWLADLTGRMAARLDRGNPWPHGWALVAALCAEAGTVPPVTEDVTRSWIAELQWTGPGAGPGTFLDRLRASPHLDLLLPSVFELDGNVVGSVIDDATFPAALVALITEGRLDRTTILAATVDRLSRPGSSAALRPFRLLHDALAPTGAEAAEQAAAYARMLAWSASGPAGMAQRALRVADEAGSLDLEVVLEVSAPALIRKEKALVKAQLGWLDQVARRRPDRAGEIAEVVAVAFEHPALDVQDRALRLVDRELPGLDPDVRARLAAAATALEGDLAARAAAIFRIADSPAAVPDVPAASPPVLGAAPMPPPVPGAALMPPPVPSAAFLPPPVGGPAELAEEIATLLAGGETPVRWERVLAGLVALRPGDDTAPLRHLLERYHPGHELPFPRSPHFTYFLPLVQRAVDPSVATPPLLSDPVPSGAPDRLLALRIVEI